MRGLHLFERHALTDRRLHAVANDNDHVSILQDIELIADPAMAGNDISPAFLFVLGHCDLENAVKSINRPLHGAALFDVD